VEWPKSIVTIERLRGFANPNSAFRNSISNPEVTYIFSNIYASHAPVLVWVANILAGVDILILSINLISLSTAQKPEEDEKIVFSFTHPPTAFI
jgi:hypothetical protein